MEMSIQTNYILEIQSKKIDLFEVTLTVISLAFSKMSYKNTVLRGLIRWFLV